MRSFRADWLVPTIGEREAAAVPVMAITGEREAFRGAVMVTMDRARRWFTPTMDSAGGQKGTSSITR